MLFVLFDIVVGFVSKVKYYVLGLLVGGVVGFVLYQLRAGWREHQRAIQAYIRVFR
jgi:uncharacterized membrane-anchored protein YhcB (DUF1043 family)